MEEHEENSKQIHLDMAMKMTVQLKKDLEPTLKDGVTFKLTSYLAKRKVGESFIFQPFYTHPRGYHMAFEVYANGNGDAEGTHTSLSSHHYKKVVMMMS